MSWQDAVLTAGSVVFVLALLPTLAPSSGKPARSTSLAQGSVLLVFAATYLTLALPLTAAITATSGALWLVIYWQAVRGHNG